ncbi:hypothetical protein GVX82_04020 [Patescibacteria group bacterium]|nr:hypothetical protein [Patescibacteria group bacterium]
MIRLINLLAPPRPQKATWFLVSCCVLTLLAPHGARGDAPEREAEVAPQQPRLTTEQLGPSGGREDFVVGPGKIELVMEPGETRTVEVAISNRMGAERTFQLSTEDLSGSPDAERAVVLHGAERGPYTLRDYLFPAANRITIEDGIRTFVPVTVSIPEDAEPGGRYGALLVSVTSDQPQSAAGAVIVSRVGVMFFVRVTGEVEEQGAFTTLNTETGRRFYTDGPIEFSIGYRNDGNVHLNPYGRITIENTLGNTVAAQEIDPWFALPNSERARTLTWDRPLLFGRYTATVELNLGYDNAIETKRVSFWVIPIGLVGLILLGLFLIFFVLRFLVTRIEIKVK